jgi:hypothetical protein
MAGQRVDDVGQIAISFADQINEKCGGSSQS